MALNLDSVDSLKRIEQIEKIIKYAKAILNVDVKFISKDKSQNQSGGYIAPTGQRKAEVLIGNYHSGIETILILIHELGHHIDFLQRGYVHEEEVAYHHYPENKGEACPKKWRKYILNTEYQAIIHAREIATYLDLKLPPYTYLKDEIYNILSLKFILEKGQTSKNNRRELWKLASKYAKQSLINNKLPPINHLIVYF